VSSEEISEYGSDSNNEECSIMEPVKYTTSGKQEEEDKKAIPSKRPRDRPRKKAANDLKVTNRCASENLQRYLLN